MLKPLADFTEYLGNSLKSFDALSVGRTFYFELTGCDLKAGDGTGFAVVCEPSRDSTQDDLRCARMGECEREPGILGSVFLATVNTLAALWNRSTWLGVLIYAAALGLSGFWLARRLKPEGEPFLWLSWVVLVPAAASVAALGLAFLLKLCVVLFTKTLAGIAWVIVTFGFAIPWFKAGMQVFATAHKVDEIGEDIPSGDAPKTPPQRRVSEVAQHRPGRAVKSHDR